MADYGARFIRSDDSGFQIDQDYRNYELAIQATAHLRGGRNRVGIPATLATPLISLRTTGTPVAWIGLEKDGSGQTVAFEVFADSGVNIDYRVFVPANVTQGVGYGLQVFNESEQPVFDSNKRYLVIPGNVGLGDSASSRWYIASSFGGYKEEYFEEIVILQNYTVAGTGYIKWKTKYGVRQYLYCVRWTEGSFDASYEFYNKETRDTDTDWAIGFNLDPGDLDPTGGSDSSWLVSPNKGVIDIKQGDAEAGQITLADVTN